MADLSPVYYSVSVTFYFSVIRALHHTFKVTILKKTISQRYSCQPMNVGWPSKFMSLICVAGSFTPEFIKGFFIAK